MVELWKELKHKDVGTVASKGHGDCKAQLLDIKELIKDLTSTPQYVSALWGAIQHS